MKKRRYFVAAILLAAYLLRPTECLAKLNVLTTHTVLKSIAEEVGGQHVSVSCLSTGREDPHAIQAKPSYMVKARRADLFIKIGMDLEIGYEQLVVDGSRNGKIRLGEAGYMDTSLNVHRRGVPTTKVDRSMGDVHPQGDPHYWMDPYNARLIALSISRRLASLDPANAAAYEANFDEFERRIDEAMFGKGLLGEVEGDRLWSLQSSGKLEAYMENRNLGDKADGWHRQMKPLRGAKVITYHRSWDYFAERFGLDIVAELEPKPGIPPSPGHLRHVIDVATVKRVGMILMEPFYNRKAADFVAERTGAMTVEATNAVEGQPGVNDYFSLIDNVIRKLKEAAAAP